MLQVARLAPTLLGESADLVASYLLDQIPENRSGGFLDRADQPDLYYTVFGMESMIALCRDLPAESLSQYLQSFSQGADLDFIHLCCLTHCWAAMPKGRGVDTLSDDSISAMLARIELHRTDDGGYNVSTDAGYGSAYGCFMAYSAYQNLKSELPDPQRMIDCLLSLKQSQGGYANDSSLGTPTTPTTAAVVTLLRQLDQPIDASTGDWLYNCCHVQGGFLATPVAPMPDLLSTAVALHALAGLKVDLDRIKEPCLDFIDSLWTNKGSFHGNWADNELDVEYTFYGLLALGHLSL